MTRVRSDGAPFDRARRRPATLRRDVLAVVFVGGCLGGVARYAVTRIWPTATGRFPWPTLVVNVVGAFVLVTVIVIAVELTASRYLRPLVGTGFCGGLTTFSSVVVGTDQLLAHHHTGTALAYLALTVLGALSAAALGLVLARTAVRGISGDRPRRRRSLPVGEEV